MGKTTAGHHRTDPGPLGKNLSFHLLWSSTFASGFGDRLAMLAVMVMLGYGLTEINGEPVSASSIDAGKDFFFFLPYLIWGPFAGWLADRLPRKWIMFVSDELRGLIILYAFSLLPSGHSGVVPPDHQWKIYALMMAIGWMAATFNPARTSVIPNVVGVRFLQRANAVVISLGVIGNLLGFLVGGPLAQQSVRWAVLGSAFCYLGSGLFWIFLKTPAKPEPGVKFGQLTAGGISGPLEPLRQIGNGIRYIWNHKPVRVLSLIAVFFWSGTAIYLPALAAINMKVYGGEVASYAYLSGMVGLGMLAGSIGLGVLNSRLGGELLLVIGLVGSAVFIGLQMIVPVYAVGMALALGVGLFGGVLTVTVNTMLQQVTPDGVRGRVIASKDMVAQVGKVGVAFWIWQLPESDALMRPLSLLLALGMLAMAVWGTWRFVLRGPAATRWENLFWRILRLYAAGVHKLEVRDAHRVPSRGAVVLVSNHRSGLDPALIQAAVARPVRWMMAREYMTARLKWLWQLIRPIPVRRGMRDSQALRQGLKALRAGEVVGVFPEGGLGPGGDEVAPFGPGVGMLAVRSGAAVVPVWVSGPPYGRIFGAYLRMSRSRVTFGKPLRFGETCQDGEVCADEKAKYEAATERVREAMRSLSGATEEGR